MPAGLSAARLTAHGRILNEKPSLNLDFSRSGTERQAAASLDVDFRRFAFDLD